tara:strand:- start:987 stop:1157 length:171 start_codon:yes stop_codon:yes gene_type:complete
MIREFEKKIEKFISEKIPDPIKLVFFYGLAFYAGYIVGDFGYNNYEDAIIMMCQVH